MLNRAVANAFASMERIESLMSVHDPASELSLVNREAAEHPVRVSTETCEVLRRGLDLARESSGAFDFTVAPLLALWGLLPSMLKRRCPGNWQAVRVLRGQRIQFDRPLALDLGGIAKGYAVDRAVAALQAAGVSSGWVNAGGDLRAFGDRPLDVGIRHPRTGQRLPSSLRIENEALATSSPTFSLKRWKGAMVSHLVNPRLGCAMASPIAVTVRAAECWIADALTKAVINSMNVSNASQLERMLDRHQATAQVFSA
jgi:thiamine biosynthesis lipoprotein